MAVLPPDPVFCLISNMGYIHSICFDKNENDFSKTLYAATENGMVYVWDLDTNRVRKKQKLGESIQAIHSIKNGLITQEKMGSIKTWSIENDEFALLNEYNCYGGYCRCILLFDDVLVVSHEHSTLDAICVNDMKRLRTFSPEKDKLGNAMSLQKGELNNKVYILGGYETGYLILWEFSTGKLCTCFKLKEYITSMTFDSVTCRGVCSNSSDNLQIFTIDKSSFEIVLKCEITLKSAGCSVVKVRPDRKICVAGCWNGFLRIFSWKSLRPLAVLTEHKKTLTDIQFSPLPVKQWDATIMAASGEDGMISLWNLYN